MDERGPVAKTLGLLVRLILLLGLIYPLFRLIGYGFTATSQSSLWNDPYFWSIVRFTYFQAVVCTFIAGLLGIGFGIIYSDWDLKGRSWLWNVSLIYFILPSVLVIQGLVASWGNQGIFAQSLGFRMEIYGWSGIILAHVLMNFPLFFRSTGLALRELGRDTELAALSLGSTRWQTWKQITWPKLWPSVARTGLISFIFCSSSFLIVLLLGGNPRFTTIEVAIYHSVRVNYDPNLAAKLALFQLGVGLIIFLLMRKIRLHQPEEATHWVSLYGPRTGLLRWLAWGFIWVLSTLLILPPLASLIVASVQNATWETLAGTLPPWLGSMKLASLSGFLAVSFAMAIALTGRRAEIDFAVGIPLVISTILLSLSWMVAYHDLFFRLRGSPFLICTVQAFCVLPVVYRVISDSFERVTQAYMETARTLGATPWQVFRYVSIPLMRPALVTAFIIAAGFSLGEVGTLLMLMDESISTLPLTIYRLMSQYRFGDAGMVSGVLLLTITALFFCSSKAERWHSR